MIAAVLLGGVSIFGGRGALHGVIGGVLLIGVLASALRLGQRHLRCDQHHHGRAARALGGLGQPADLGAEAMNPDRYPDELVNQRKETMKFTTKWRAAAILAAVGLTLATAACGGGDEAGRRGVTWSVLGTGGGCRIRRSPSCPRTSATRTSTASDKGGEDSDQGVLGGTYGRGRPDRGDPRGPTGSAISTH